VPTARLIAELNTRFSASRAADPIEYDARLQLLAEDCTDIPPRFLDAAIRACAKVEDFLPSAAKLRKAAYEAEDMSRSGDARADDNQARVAQANAKLQAEGSPLRWSAKGSGPWVLNELTEKSFGGPPVDVDNTAALATMVAKCNAGHRKLMGSSLPDAPKPRAPTGVGMRTPTAAELAEIAAQYPGTATGGASPALKAMLGITTDKAA
jgi:hypothetical protein